MKEEEVIIVEEDTQVAAEKKLEEINLGTDPQKPRHISISSKLSGEEKLELKLLLKEFKDFFTCDYSKILGLDPGLVVHTLNVDLEAKPVTQPARVFYQNRRTDSKRGAKAIGY